MGHILEYSTAINRAESAVPVTAPNTAPGNTSTYAEVSGP